VSARGKVVHKIQIIEIYLVAVKGERKFNLINLANEAVIVRCSD
jgi:hypothetical protein